MAARSPPARTARAPRPPSAASRRATPNACPPTTRCSTRAVELLRSQLLETPPADPRRLRDLWGALQLGRHFRKLDAEVQRDIHELFTRSAGDLLDHWFESDAVKALYGFDAVVGNYASPYTPGSAYVLLHHVFGEVNGKTGVWGHAVGGMGAITQAMATEARRLGVTLETDAPVKRIVVERGAPPASSSRTDA